MNVLIREEDADTVSVRIDADEETGVILENLYNEEEVIGNVTGTVDRLDLLLPPDVARELAFRIVEHYMYSKEIPD